MARTGIQRGKGPTNRTSATSGHGETFKTEVGGSPKTDRKGANRYNRR